jgi:hypothetical protein
VIKHLGEKSEPLRGPNNPGENLLDVRRSSPEIIIKLLSTTAILGYNLKHIVEMVGSHVTVIAGYATGYYISPGVTRYECVSGPVDAWE